jgi:hypothetical protein
MRSAVDYEATGTTGQPARAPSAETVRAPEPSRETRRAPDSGRGAGVRTDVPSARPTAAPNVDLDALAGSCLRRDSAADLPLDLAVLVRVPGADLEALDHRAAFLLVNVDGASTIADIAARSQLPIAEAIAIFLELIALRAVEIARSVHETDPEGVASGIFAKFQDR